MSGEPDPQAPRRPSAEFDAYAPDYAAGMENPVKALLGRAADDYLAVKLDWLLHAMPGLAAADASFRLLDYGCGTAALLRLMARRGLRARLAGCDIAAGMLAEAERLWPPELPPPDLRPQEGAAAPFANASFDLVVISAVLHHVPLQERPAVYAELHRLTRPGGHVVVFEHNPLNPVTRYVIARTPIDRNAILLYAGEAAAGLVRAGFPLLHIRYLMFAPPRLNIASRLDPVLGRLPFGAQYAVTARRVS